MDIDFDIDQFVDRFVAVWNEPDPVARRRAVVALWAEDGVGVGKVMEYRGHDALEVRVAEAHNEFVRDGGFVFRAADDATWHHDMLTFTAHMVPAGGGDIAWTARIFAVLDEDERIRSDYQFPEPIARGSALTRAIAKDFLRRLGEGDPDRIAELFAEQVDWVLDWPAGGHPAVPWIRPRSTRADVADHFRAIAEFHVPGEAGGPAPRVLVDGNEAVVLGDIRQTVKATGKPYTALCALHLVVEDGLITRYAVYEDSLTVAEALSGS
ncbi:nuclear transport factor 2 family protein [Saccharopolyspora sp. NPDC050642]|uniref:nuclear transport factor 2 family protein n=1 Tax=Saccharopolyspora sp. NPDC050642 TaxID=3157099 RepID=UPI0034044E44